MARFLFKQSANASFSLERKSKNKWNQMVLITCVFIFRIPANYSKGHSWSWSYGSWIYNYLCNQSLSPLKLWVRIPFRRGWFDNMHTPITSEVEARECRITKGWPSALIMTSFAQLIRHV
jgi:hypothetical protein